MTAFRMFRDYGYVLLWGAKLPLMALLNEGHIAPLSPNRRLSPLSDKAVVPRCNNFVFPLDYRRPASIAVRANAAALKRAACPDDVDRRG
jgi:hypothetical protein